MNPWLISIPVAYLLGSIPFGYLLVRFVRHEDIRTTGSGNIGATNVLRSGAKGLGIATLLLDLGKAIPRRRARQAPLRPGKLRPRHRRRRGSRPRPLLSHLAPFKGGKGVASALGVFLALTWPSALCILAVFILIVARTRFVSLASIIAAATLPFFALYFVPNALRLSLQDFSPSPSLSS